MDAEIDKIIKNVDQQQEIKKIAFLADAISAVKDHITNRRLVITGDKAIEMIIKTSEPFNRKYIPYSCYVFAGMVEIGTLIKKFRSLKYESISTSTTTISDYFAICRLTVKYSAKEITLFEAWNTTKVLYDHILETSVIIDKMRVINPKITRILIYSELTSSHINPRSTSDYLRAKIAFESAKSPKSAIKTISGAGSSSAKGSKGPESIYKAIADNKKCLLVDPGAFIGEKPAGFPVTAVCNDLKEFDLKLGEIGRILSKYKANVGKQRTIFGTRLYITINSKHIITVYDVSRYCTPYVNVNVNAGSTRVCDYYTTIKWILIAGYLGEYDADAGLISKMEKARDKYLSERNLIGIEPSIFRVLNFECMSYDSSSIYAFNDIYPKILLWNYKKNYPDEYLQTKKECKPIKIVQTVK